MPFLHPSKEVQRNIKSSNCNCNSNSNSNNDEDDDSFHIQIHHSSSSFSDIRKVVSDEGYTTTTTTCQSSQLQSGLNISTSFESDCHSAPPTLAISSTRTTRTDTSISSKNVDHNNNNNNYSTSTNNTNGQYQYNAKKYNMFTSVKLKRLEELKRHRDFNNDAISNPFHNHVAFDMMNHANHHANVYDRANVGIGLECDDVTVTSNGNGNGNGMNILYGTGTNTGIGTSTGTTATVSPIRSVRSVQLSPSATTIASTPNSTPRNNHTRNIHNNTNNNTPSSPIMPITTPSSSSPSSLTSVSYLSKCYSWETALFQKIEESILSFIDGSTLRITVVVTGLLFMVHTMLSSFDNVTSTTSSSSSMVRFMMEVFIANMKLFTFVIVNGLILDVILISAFDNVDIPIIIQRKDVDTSATWTPSSPPPNNPTIPIPTTSTTTRSIMPTVKNPIIRQYVMTYIRKATSYISVFITACGLFKSIIYVTLSRILNIVDYVSGLYPSILLQQQGGEGGLGGFMMSILLKYIISIPYKCASTLLQCTIPSIANRIGLSFLIRSFVTSVANSNSTSLFVQCMDVMKSLMMYSGVFMLVFYSILVHCYPQQQQSSNSNGNGNRGVSGIGKEQRSHEVVMMVEGEDKKRK